MNSSNRASRRLSTESKGMVRLLLRPVDTECLVSHHGHLHGCRNPFPQDSAETEVGAWIDTYILMDLQRERDRERMEK